MLAQPERQRLIQAGSSAIYPLVISGVISSAQFGQSGEREEFLKRKVISAFVHRKGNDEVSSEPRVL